MTCLELTCKQKNVKYISADALYHSLKEGCGLSSRTFLAILRGLCDRRDKFQSDLTEDAIIRSLSLDAVLQLCCDSAIDAAIRHDIVQRLKVLPGFSEYAWHHVRLPKETYDAYSSKSSIWYQQLG